MRLALLALPCLSVLLAAAAPAQIRSGPWQTAGKVPEGWVVHNTRNYHVQSECGPEKAKRLGDHMEVMNAVYRQMFKPAKGGVKQQTIKLFKDQKSFLRYAARIGVGAGAAAYYSPDQREMVCYDTGKWSDEEKVAVPLTGERTRRPLSQFEDLMKMDLLGCAAHEGWHQYYHWLVVSRVDLPSWINEGMGDYFYTASPQEGKRKHAELGGVNDGRLWVLKTAKRQARMVPLEEFVRMLQQDYYSNPSICYAQGWALCQFLLHGADGKYAKLIPNYVRLICNDTNWESVQTKVFKGIDFAQLEREFHAYVDTLKDPGADDEPAEAVEVVEPPPPPPAEPGKQPPGGDPAGG